MDELNVRDMGMLIRKKRKEKKMRQGQLAALLRVSVSAVAKWESGTNCPDIQNLKALMQALDISPHEILGSEPDKSSISGTESIPKEGESGADDDNAPQPAADEPADLPLQDIEETVPPLRPAEKAWKWKAAVLFLSILLVATVVLIFVMLTPAVQWPEEEASGDDLYSFEILEEFYDDYNGKKAYYIVVACDRDITEETLNKYDSFIREKYAEYFNTSHYIVIAYFEEGNVYEKNGILDNCNYCTVLYP